MKEMTIVVRGIDHLRAEDGRPIEGLLLNTYDGGETWYAAVRLDSRWGIQRDVEVTDGSGKPIPGKAA